MKEELKHTPEPWKLDGTVVEAKWENGQSVMVCQAGGTRWGGCPNATELNNRMRGENIANATLIAAAPDMLNALNALCSEIAKESGDLDAPYEQARAAIAKARGVK
jgi:hypothetical protein